MKVPISWLKDYVDITISIEELAERLTLAGMEVEHIEYYGRQHSERVSPRSATSECMSVYA